MKLIRLEIQGFKSFKDKTIIHFDEGITGIVGPNGCGKSNIVDALFWVMGEQSAKHLRGSKMKDLIFAGSSKYSPGSWAEVTLVLLNDTGKHIHIGNQVAKPQEIALTRKLYRNGETEYRINGIPARLKDIHEVFMDTGAGAKSYSIIAQGEINKLVQAKPQERRTMIEEVAGITKFKLRKRESLKKIEHTQTNLNRLEDLQSEIYKNLKALEKQAEKAEKAKLLKERIQRHELILMSHKEFDYLNDYTSAKKGLDERAIAHEEFSLRKNQLELALEDERIKKTDLMEKIDELQADYNEMARELAASEERLKHLKTTREDKLQHIEVKEKENEELKQDIEQRSQRLTELKEKLLELQEGDFENVDVSDREDRVENLRETLKDKEDEYSDIDLSLDDVKVQLNEYEQKIFRNNSKIEEYSASLEDIAAEIEDIEKSTAGFSDEVVEQRKKVQELKEKTFSLEESKKELKLNLEQKSVELKDRERKLKELSKEVITIESKKESLVEINRSGEGIKEGGLKFIEANDSSNFEVLGNLIECEKEYAKALEVLFESTFDSLVSRSKDISTLLSWQSQNTDLGFDCIVPEALTDSCGEETIERLRLKGCSGIVVIDQILKINNSEFESSLKTFFNGFYIVEKLDNDIVAKITSEIKFKGLISLDGKAYVIKTPNGLKVSVRSEFESTMGVVQRNNLINELTEAFEAKNQELEELEASTLSLDEDVTNLRAKYDEVEAEFALVNGEYIGLKSSLDSKENSLGSSNTRLDILTNRKSEISKLKLEILESEETLENEKQALADKVEGLVEKQTELKDEIDELKISYETERGELLEIQANAKTFHTQIESFESQIQDVQGQIERYNEKTASNEELLEKYQTEIESAQETVETLSVENEDKVEELKEKESILNIIKDDLTTLLSDMQDRENEVKTLTSKLNKIEKENVELNLKTEQIIVDEEVLVKDCFDRYRVDLRATLAPFLEILPQDIEELQDLEPMYFMEGEDGPIKIEAQSYYFEKKFPAVIRESKEKFKRYKGDLNRLGEINWQAVEDYDRQKLRHTFLKEQEQELKKSLEDLELAISHIDEKSKLRFEEAYKEVNTRFEKVFPIIFGGGEARLEIIGNLDDIECGIDIVAKPPGKKMQSINLMSGGEKAMTAVSLIFSIFLVKPSPFCLLDEVDAPLDDANVGRFNELLREMSSESQFILITHNKKTMELNDTLYGVTMQEPGVSKAVSVQLQ